MKVSQFRTLIANNSAARMGLRAFADYLMHRTRDDKQLREELLVIKAVVRYRQLPDDAEIEIGGETQVYDACVDGELIEITQALPKEEHAIRHAIATGSVKPAQWWKHAGDHLQFPSVIIAAIEKKHKKHYSDRRTLVVTFDGVYAEEDDSIITGWISEIRQKSNKGAFEHILLVDRARAKAFEVF